MLLCVSQEENNIPYKFKSTNINVYSLEEALFHCFKHWKQSVDDFVSDDFIDWVNNTLGLSFYASKIKDIAKNPSLTRRFISFLSIIDYFSESELERLKDDLSLWEKRFDWERLKERADYHMQNNEPGKAVALYKEALYTEVNVQLLNNLAIALMRLGIYEEAAQYFARIFDDAGFEARSDVIIVLNYAEACIYTGAYDKAVTLLTLAERIDPDNPDIPYLYGELNLKMGNIRYALDHFYNALQIYNDPHYIYRIADVYIKLRQFDKSLETLEKIEVRDRTFYIRQSETYAAANNLPAAIKSIEKALSENGNSAELWVKLAMYHRLDYDIVKANSAIIKALSIDPSNEVAKLENARIKKALGRIKDYQLILNDILKGFKSKYRDLMN